MDNFKLLTGSTHGYVSKAIYRISNKYYMVKGCSKYNKEPLSEVLGSRIFKQFSGIDTIEYMLGDKRDYPNIKTYGFEYVSICEMLDFGITPFWRVVEATEEVNKIKSIEKFFEVYNNMGLDENFFHKMMIMDSLISNKDRHLNNFDVYVNKSGEVKNAPVLDFGASLLYDIEDIDLSNETIKTYNRSSTLFKIHDEQINTIINRIGNKKLFKFTVNEFEDWLENENVDIFDLVSEKREYYIKELIMNNLNNYVISFI